MRLLSHFVALVFCILTPLSFTAQVGVNEDTPSQQLDVNGKLEISDDNEPPTAGAIRYSSTNSDFEGYNGTQWSSFTMGQGNIPSGAIPCYAKETIETDGSVTIMTISEMSGNDNSFTQVPTDKYFIVTGASIVTGNINGAVAGTNYTVRISGTNDLNDEVIWIRGRYDNGLESPFTNGFAPLIILQEGESLRVQHPNFAEDQEVVSVYVRGWVVNDLNY